MTTANDAETVARLTGLAPGLGAWRTRPMFGCTGLYLDDLFVGLVSGGDLFLKTDALADARFDADDAPPFVVTMRGRPTPTSFRRAPLAALADAAGAADWLGVASAAARRKAAR